MIEQLSPEELDRPRPAGIDLLPEPLVRRNPTLSNPFVRSKVYELACLSQPPSTRFRPIGHPKPLGRSVRSE